jgi:TDG/mug DNA glycosylase family protein
VKRDRAESVTFDSAVPDVLAPGLKAVFCGINPGRVSAAAAAHFANPRNDFWRLLQDALLTPRLLAPHEQHELLEHGFGITNAAARTTPRSGDLRRADFAGAADRLARIARELRPGAIAFVGKEAYRGAFGERPELGLQERSLGDTWLFVLPSTSPANAGVPYVERLRWFDELAGRLTGKPLRRGVRALLLDHSDRTLLVRYDVFGRTWWGPPGGGVEGDETEIEALTRELLEELALGDPDIGPCIWSRTHWFGGMTRHGGQRERLYLVRTRGFEPAPELGEELLVEGADDWRWWTLEELAASPETFAPRRLPQLFRALLADGPPREPVDVGV